MNTEQACVGLRHPGEVEFLETSGRSFRRGQETRAERSGRAQWIRMADEFVAV
jgi:hypothetical protein